jgi:hypothetical protein
MTARMKAPEAWSYAELPLGNGVVAERGLLAAYDLTNNVLVLAVSGSPSAVLVPLGYFDEDRTGDGTTPARVQLFREVWLHWFKNDGTNPVLAANIFDDCYLVDGRTVSISSLTNTRSKAGKVWAVDSVKGVLISPAMPV